MSQSNQKRTRAKICGITRKQDVQAVVAAGADAIGFVFFPPSPRDRQKDRMPASAFKNIASEVHG
ncbi:hypothetical protein OQ620_28030, partial [Klebsiella pneumoniae]|nr:hypothetical protein [Klebsiella pneumoniae]